MKKYIKSPINYTGNKYRLLEQFESYLPRKTKKFVDLFCGGATVGFNVDAEEIILIDNNPRVINLLSTLAENDIDKIIETIEEIIKKYNLSYSLKKTYKYYRELGYVEGNNGLKKYNINGYKKLKEDYNNLKKKDTFKANIMLYVLMVYGFNNDLRFNHEGKFNLPIGKTDFNKNNYEKLIEFNKRAQNINYKFVLGDFREKKIQELILNADYLYCDPPYLITTAVYNENGGWTKNEEKALLELLDKVNSKNIPFALSNVLKKEGKINELLNDWIEKNNFEKHKIEYHYRSSSYNKKNRNANEEEVLITGGEKNAED